MNDFYSKDISLKVRSSQQVKREKGEFVGSFTPYGYRKACGNRNKLEPDEPAARIVRDIFDKKMSGYSASAIANELNERGILSPAEYKRANGVRFSTTFGHRSGSKWSAQTVIRLLKNEVYIGTLAQGKREQINYKVRKQVDVPSSDWIRCENTHEAIISRSVFDTVQNLMNRDTISAKGSRMSYIYSGLLYCGDCGASMIRRNNPRKPGAKACYICSSKNVRGTCSRHRIGEEALNEAVFGFLNDYIDRLKDRGRMSEELGGMVQKNEAAIANDREIARLRKELEECGAFRASLYQDFRRGIINEQKFHRFRGRYAKRAEELEAAIREQEKYARESAAWREDMELRLKDFKERLNVGGLDRVLLATFIDRILVFDGGVVEVKARFAGC